MSTLQSTAYRGTHAALPRRSRLIVTLRRIVLRLRVAAQHDALDDALARGADPASRPALALRAVQLERMRHRRVIERTLRRTVADAMMPPPPARSTTTLIERRQVRADAAELIALADRLGFPQPAGVGGIAIAQRLVTDGLDSPLYNACEPHTLGRLARLALAELGPFD